MHRRRRPLISVDDDTLTNAERMRRSKHSSKKSTLTRCLRRIVFCCLFVLFLCFLPHLFTKYRDIIVFYWQVTSQQRIRNPPKKQEIHIPAEVRASVVLMNHSRPRMIKESSLMLTLLAHSSIDEVLLCHSNSQTQFQYNHPKVKNINAIEANHKMGLSLRFHFCKHAKNEWVIMVDDDQEMSPTALDELISEFVTNPHRIVGRYGRGYTPTTGYRTTLLQGDVEVVLTKFMILERPLCDAFFQYQHLVQDIVFKSFSPPLWNGEDIFMSLVANHVYKVPFHGPYNNYAIPMDVWEASDSYKDDDLGRNDVSGNMNRHSVWKDGLTGYLRAVGHSDSHLKYRGHLWGMAKQRLADLHDLE